MNLLSIKSCEDLVTYITKARTLPLDSSQGFITIIDTDSPAYIRMRTAGFEFGLPSANLIDDGRLAVVYFPFKCVCGTQESFQKTFSTTEISNMCSIGVLFPFDIAKALEDFGSVSEEHLREDGYTEEQIRDIRKAYHD